MSTGPDNVVELGAKLGRIAFLEWYVRHFPGGTHVQIAAIHPETEDIHAQSAPRDDVASLRPFIEEHVEAWNLYYVVNPLRKSKAKKATRADISHLACVHGDYDPRKGHDLRAEQQLIAERLAAFRPQPSLDVGSGRGLQSVWLLTEPVPVDGDADELSKHNQLLGLLLGGDRSTKDICRLMRLPGTTNFPTKTKIENGWTEITQASVLRFSNVTYRLEDFGVNALPVSAETRALIRDGDTKGHYPSTSEMFFRVVAELLRANVAEEAIELVSLDPANKGCAHAQKQKNPEHAIKNAIKNARRGNADQDWHGTLARKGEKVIADERNVIRALRTAPELHGLVRFNEFALRIEFTRAPPWRDAADSESWADHDDVEFLAWLQEHRIAYRTVNGAYSCVVVVARDRSYHPVREFLNGLAWDGAARLDTWLADLLGATGEPRYLAAVGRAFLISAVARIFKPGIKADHMLVLEGIQGKGKTTTAEKLVVNPDWFTDDIGNVHDKDSAMKLASRWIVEFAELDAMRKSDVTAMKAFVSRRIDKFRPPYGRSVVEVPRQCVFIGTTNEGVYLKDQTGNRRYWPVRCGRVNAAAVEIAVQQLWAEALHTFRAGEQWWLSDEVAALAEIEQAERVAESEVEVTVAEFVARRVADNTRRPAHIPAVNAFTTRDVFAALGYPPSDPEYAMRVQRVATEVANALLRAGCTKYRKVGKGGKHERIIYMLPGVRGLTPEEIEKTRGADVEF